MCSRKLKKRRRETQEEASPRKYAVTMEEVPDEEMPNGEIPIEDREDLFRTIRGGQSWDKNPQKIDKPVEEIVPKKYHEHLSVFLKKGVRKDAFAKTMGSWYRIEGRIYSEKVEGVSLVTIEANRSG